MHQAFLFPSWAKETKKQKKKNAWSQDRHRHTETFSGEMLKYMYLPNNIQREGKAGSKNWAKATACKSNMSKMIDFTDCAVKDAKAQDHPIYNIYIINRGSWPALSRV